MVRNGIPAVIGRRRVVTGLAAGAAVATLSSVRSHAQAKPRVVIIGGGAAGVCVMRALLSLAGDTLDISLIVGERPYSAPFAIHAFNENDGCTTAPIHAMAALAGFGVRVIAATAQAIDTDASAVKLNARGVELPALGYDLLVAAPGISLNWKGIGEVKGRIADPLWTSDATCNDLKALFRAVPDGGRLAIVAPAGGHRCPPSVYERACLAASWFKRHQRTASVTIIDEKDAYPLQAQFEAAYADYYDGMIEWVPKEFHGGLKSVDFTKQEIQTEAEVFKADVLNVIPPQRAAEILIDAGLTDESGFAPVEAATMRSSIDKKIYVVGDAARAGELSKSATAAKAAARLAAADIVLQLLQIKLAEPTEVFDRCWSLVAPNDAIYMAATYEADGAGFKTLKRSVSDVEDDAKVRRKNAVNAAAWPLLVMRELYGPA